MVPNIFSPLKGMQLHRRAKPFELPPRGHARLRGPLQHDRPPLPQRLPHQSLQVGAHEAPPINWERKHRVIRMFPNIHTQLCN